MSGNQIFEKFALSKASIVLALAACLSFSFSQVANAQTAQPQFLMTWHAAGSYTPSWYQGKALPNTWSHITASLEIISQGKTLDLSGQTIYWYLDNNLLGGGVGVQTITFLPYGVAPNNFELKVELPDYPSGLLIHEIAIPTVTPVAVIEAPYPQGQFPKAQVDLSALPYFFNATSSSALAYTWIVNGQTTSNTENPQSLQVTMPASTPAGFALAVSLNIQNSIDATDGSAEANLTYQPGL